MRGTTKTVIGGASPVFSVMPRLKPGQTEIRYFIMFVPCCGSPVEHQLIHFDREVLIRFWLQARADVIRQRRSFMHFKQIERQVLGPEREGFVEIAAPSVQRLTRQPGNQVKANIIETRVS